MVLLFCYIGANPIRRLVYRIRSIWIGFLFDNICQSEFKDCPLRIYSLYNEWKTSHADLSLAIQHDATELKNRQFTKQFQEAAKNIQWERYKLDNTKVKKRDKDMPEKLSEVKGITDPASLHDVNSGPATGKNGY